jgi:pimeloyl-ACP methyl ester carboxylesterase
VAEENGAEADPPLEAMVSAIIDKASIPGRPREPRLASELLDAEQVDVATPHGNVAAWRVGTGAAVLLVHGWRDSARLWGPLMDALRERGRPFIALDRPGHGLSEGERCLQAEVPDAVLAVTNALGPVDAAVAHSFATTGIGLAVAEGLSADRLVLIAPPLAYRTPGDAAGDAVDAGHQRWRRIAAELGYDPTVGDQALEAYLTSLGPTRVSWDLTDGLAALDCDVLIVASADDERFDLASARDLVQRLPRCSLAELVGPDHRASARDPVAVETIVDYLTR